MSPVSIVTEAMFSPGGGDRVLSAMIDLFPEADVYTPIYKKLKYEEARWCPQKEPRTFFPRWMPTRLYNLCAGTFYETLGLKKYKLVVSLSARFAKSVITTPETVHVCYHFTPPRYEWDNNLKLPTQPNRLLSSSFRVWDKVSSLRPDHNIASSFYVAQKLRKYYKLEAEVIHPGVDEFWWEKPTKQVDLNLPKQFFLIVSRLVDYKRIDVAIRACLEAKKHLVVVGDGSELRSLKGLARGSRFIHFLNRLSDEAVRYLYSEAISLIFPGEEDFGLTPVEAMAQGCPVIALNKGGVIETVIDGETGLFFEDECNLIRVLKDEFPKRNFNKNKIVQNARNFTEEQFKMKFMKFLDRIMKS